MRNRDEDELSDILIDDDEEEKETKGRSKKIFDCCDGGNSLACCRVCYLCAYT